MSLCAISIKGYRSVRTFHVNLGQLSVFVGANGVGKTNLYRGLALLQAAAEGTITRAVAAEGGIDSVLWAGTRNKSDPARLCLAAHFDDLAFGYDAGAETRPHKYEIEIGLPQVGEGALYLEALVKLERLTMKGTRRDVVMMERQCTLVSIRNAEGAMETIEDAVLSSETALAGFRDVSRYPELEAIRREMQEWRLYHDFRTDAESALRRPALAITTPSMAPDGHDLASVLATIALIREDTVELDAMIDDAFPGATLQVNDGRPGRGGEQPGWCTFDMTFPEMPRRAFEAKELSDGTLKYLALLGALMGYRLPPFIALNEPEGSLHPDLLPALARLIARAAEKAQVWVVTHSDILAKALEDETGRRPGRIVKEDGATTIEGLTIGGDWGEE